jgi:uncharacterized repeat protein (TIGR02543 family)
MVVKEIGMKLNKVTSAGVAGVLLVGALIVYQMRDVSSAETTVTSPVAQSPGPAVVKEDTSEASPVPVVPPVVAAAAAESIPVDDTFKRFDEWVGRYRAAGKPGHGELLGEGVALAKERRESFRSLIRTNPEEAVARAKSPAELAEIPGAVGMFLERHVQGPASSSMFSPGGIDHYTDNYRELMVRGEALNSYVYGNRAKQLLFRNDDIHGVAVGPDMAVEDAAQITEDLLAKANLPGKVTEGVVKTTVEFSEADLEFSTANGYDRVGLKDGVMRNDKAGTPWLPTRGVQVLLPAGALVQSVTATAADESLLRSGVNLMPAQPPIPLSAGVKAEFVEPDPDAYASTLKFPASLVDGNAAGRRKGWTTVGVPVNPVRYIPASRDLYLAKRVEITVRYELPPVPPVVFTGQKAAEEQDATSNVVNAGQAGASPYYVGRGDWSAEDWLSGEDAAAAQPLDGDAQPLDDDPQPLANERINLSSSTYSITESGGNLTVTVTISKGPAATATVNYSTASGTATAGSDFTAVSGTLTWAAGDASSRSFQIPINDDILQEGSETFTVTLSNPTGGTVLGTASATVTITDNDTPGAFKFSLSSYDVMENDATVSLTVERVNGASGAVSVNYATVDDTAMAGQDYTAASGTLNFANGETSKDISVTILNDTNYEGVVESFNVVLSSPTGGSVLGSPATAAVNISEDDPMPGAVDYVIITSASLASSCAALKAHRESFNGFKVEIRDITWILANYSGVKPNGGSDTQTAVRNFIKDYVVTRGLKYACVVGDNSVVEDRDCRISCYGYTVNAMPTDFYWAGLDGTWDADVDGIYGEPGEQDFYYDVIVGRIPVRSATHVTDYVKKMIKYETNPPQDLIGKFISEGTRGWDAYTGDSRPSDLLNDGNMQFRDPLHTTVDDTEIWGRRGYRDFVQAYGWNPSKMGCYFGTLKTPGVSTAENWNFVNHFAHGTYTSTSYMTATGLKTSLNLIAFLHTCACQTAGFDYAEPSVSESAIRNPIGGSIVYLGCSRYGWGSPGSYYGGASANLQRYWWEAIFRDKHLISGKAFYEMKSRNAPYSTYDSDTRWVQLGVNMQGDPAVMIHGIKPLVSVKVIEGLAAEPGTDTASICFERTGSVSNSLSIAYSRSGTASAPGDFSTDPATSANGSITIPAGTNRLVVTLAAVNDSTVENDEDVKFTIAASADYLINSGYSTATMTILDDDNSVTPVVALTILDATAAEQNSDPGKLRISRAGSVSTSISVNYTLSGTASAADYSEMLSGAVTLAAGVASVDITVTPVDDTLPESDETLDVTLTSGTGYTLGEAVAGTINILDNEPRPAVTISAVDDMAAEGTADTATLRFTRAGNTDLPLTVDYVLSGTASASDLSPALSGAVTIPVGTNSVDIVLTAVDDSDHELWETLVVDVVPGAGFYSVGSPSQATISIRDDDNTAPTASAGAPQVAVLVMGEEHPAVSGAHIYLNAGLDNGANATWEDSMNKWNLSINTGVTFVSDAGSKLPGITAAYDFPGGTNGAGGCDGTSLQGMVVDMAPITLELWFKPDASAGYPANGQVLWETGGTNGLGIFYRNGLVEVAHDNKQGQISADVSALTNEFIQVVVTYDTASSSDNFNLYINGLLKTTGSRSDIDLCNGDGSGLGNRGGSNAGGAGSGDASTESFDGKIAIFRAYHGRVLEADEVRRNYSSIAAYGSADVTLAGTAVDPDGDPLATTWTLVNGPTAVSFSDPSATNATATFDMPGVYTLRLTADDSLAQHSDDVVITVKSPPVADAGADQTVSDEDANGSESVTLNGTGSHDPDGVIVSYVWKEGATQIATGANPVVVLSAGTHTITLIVADNEGYTAQDTLVVRVSSVPIVVNAGGAGINGISASLSGILTGGAAANAWICWGLTDGGVASTGGWQHVVSVGGVTEGVAFSSLVTGLSTNTTYFYRSYASNSIGTAWSDTAEMFSGTPVSGQWTPSNITLAAWYDAADAGTITASSNAVSQWRDKSNQARHLNQATSGAMPKTATRTIGGLNAIEFDGTDDVLTARTNRTSAITIFGVVHVDSGSGTDANRSWLSAPGGENPDYWMPAPANADTLSAYMLDTTGSGSSGSRTAARNSAHIIGAYSWVPNGAAGGLRVDGGTPALLAAKASGLQMKAIELAVGRQKNTSGRFHDGLIGEIVIINSRLTEADDEFLRMEGYLAHKWGMAANLPTNHPYKVTAPTTGVATPVANQAPTGISETAATFNAALVAFGTNYTVRVYYGTTDGGTNAGSWASSAVVGSWTNVSTSLSYAASGLLSGAKYYYAFMASNETGTAWASPSWSFTTLTPHERIVVKPATSVVKTSAVLNGEWQNATGTVYTITAFWGEVDGGISAGSWANTANVGTFANDANPVFSQSISGLNSGTTYYYTFRAVSGSTTLWTAPRGTFLTASPPVVNTTPGAAAMSVTTAALSGLMTKGGTANAWFCWGLNDGGTASTGAWQHVVSAGSVTDGVAFSNLVTGLSTNTTYFYRCYAENTYGSDWSDAAVTFSGTPVGGLCTPEGMTFAAWYDAADAGTITAASGAVSQWNDKSGNANHLTGSGGPKTGTRTINGVNVIDFDGTDDQLMDSTFSELSTAGISIFIVQKYDRNDVQSMTAFTLERTTDTQGMILHSTYDSIFSFGYRYPENTPAQYQENTNVELLSYVKSGTTSQKKWVNGQALTTQSGAVTTFTTQRLALGSRSGGNYLDGAIGEFIIVPAASSDSDRQKIEGYLAHKWGLTSSLPASHPYKLPIANFAPTGISDSAAVFNAALNASGTNYAVTVYYGTTDGGTNAGSWAKSEWVGSWANVSTYISSSVNSLLAGTRYFYTFAISNASGVVWASPSWTFTTAVPSGPTHTITASAGTGGSITPSASVVVNEGANQAFTISANTGYTLDGVTVDGTPVGAVSGYTFTNVTAAHTIAATFTANQYTVTFNANGGTAASPASKVVTYGSTYGTLATTTREGYTFNGWFTAASGGAQVTSATTVAITADQTLYAQWTFIHVNTPPVVSAGTNQTVVLSGESATPWTPADISVAAWYDAADAATVQTSGSSVTNWLDKSGNGRNVSQATSGQQPSFASQTVSFDGTDDILFRTGAFMYANGSADIYVAGAFSGTVADKRLLAESNSGNDSTLYCPFQNRSATDITMMSAYIRDDGNTVRFHNGDNTLSATGAYNLSTRKLYQVRDAGNSLAGRVNGGTATTVSYTRGSMTLTSFGIGGIPPRPSSTTGSGWLRADVNEIIVVPSLLSDSDRQKLEGYLAHKWGMAANLPSDHPYKNTPPMNGSVPTATASLDGTATDPDGDPLTTGWSVASTTPAGLAPVTFGNAAAVDTTATFTQAGTYTLRLTADDTYTQVYSQVTITVNLSGTVTNYTVTYSGNGSTGGTAPVDGSSYTNGQTVTVLGNTGSLVKTGYTFAGWNTAANGSGTSYAPAATFAMGSANVTLYAQWTANSYTVTFNANGGTAASPASKQVTYGSTYGTLATTTRTGYTFNGWFTAASGGTLVTSGTTVAITAAQTLYAQWTWTSALPSPWVNQDVGTVGLTGSTTFSNGTFTVKGAGAGIAGNVDALHFVHQIATADCDIRVRVASLVNAGAAGKAGVMFRESLVANAREAGVWVTPANITFTYRATTGGKTTVATATGTAPRWVRLIRNGKVFSAYYSADGVAWTQVGRSVNITMVNNVYMGLGVSSGSTGALATGTIDNVTAAP